MSTLDEFRAANADTIEWMESHSGSPLEESEEFDAVMAIVLELSGGVWDMFFSSDIDEPEDDVIRYISSPYMCGARTRADIVDLLKSERWDQMLVNLAVEHDSTRA